MGTLTDFYAPFTILVPLPVEARWIFNPASADLTGDGHQDLLVLGNFYPGTDPGPIAQPGVLLLGDGDSFAPAPTSLFPWQTLQTVHAREILFEDFNGDGKLDVFVATTGWDAFPFPGEQNRLILSTSTGWADATATLPQLLDFTHAAAAADIDADGDIDIFVGNGYGGQNNILAYMLMNDGTGQFTMSRANLPAGSGEVLDFTPSGPYHHAGASFADLDGDNLPELLITADSTAWYDKLRNNVILWNQGGAFDNAHKTELPATSAFSNQIVLDFAGIDVNMDGRKDLVFTGTQGPSYDGWFVQVLQQRPDGSFADATDSFIPAADRFGGTPGVATGTPWGMWVRPMDFNGDGFPDFAVEHNSGQFTPADMPLVWLNDGTGHFTAIHAGDLTGELWRIVAEHWYPTEHGYSLVQALEYDNNGNLVLVGLAATAPYTDTPDSGMARTGTAGNDRLRGSEASADALTGDAGIDTAVYFGNRNEFDYSAGSVARIGAPADADTLVGVERLEFRDINVALDLDGNAGTAAKILGIVFGPASVANPHLAAIALEYVDDSGLAPAQLMQLALDAALGAGASNAAVVTLLYQNLVGAAPSAEVRDFYVGWITSGDYTQVTLAELAAEVMGIPPAAQEGLAFAG
ncbi:MAG: VCBS repeat-containing protein [Burkholderiales bacterium]|nr:VCBS repeat-containing protein [Burkholderiales bacterium]